MPKISVENYDTVASWNGNLDLLIVEQPDGTKVATPNMLKQFIEAGTFEATGEIKDGHGNVLKDMAKASDMDDLIDDLTGTGLMSNIMKIKQITFDTDYLTSIKNAFINGEIPINLNGFTFGCVNGGFGGQRVLFIAQNQSLSSTQTRFGALYFGAYVSPHYLYKRDTDNWVDTAL